MIVVTNKIDLDKIYCLQDNIDKINEYVISLIPERYRHLEWILSNQKYYVSQMIYRDTKLSIENKRNICKKLLKDVRVIGYINEFIFLKDIERMVDYELLDKYIKEM